MKPPKSFIVAQPAVYHCPENDEPVMNVASKYGQYVDTYIQDQTTNTFVYYFKRQLGVAYIAINTAINDYSVTLVTGHGFVAGEYISILENGRALQAKVMNVATNVITLDQPLDYAFTTAAQVRRTNVDLNVDGSSSPIIFDIVPCQCMKWHVNQITLTMTDSIEMDSGKFGGLSALTKGIVIRKKDGEYWNLLNAKTNTELDAKGFVVKYDSKAPSGVYGLMAMKQFNGQSGSGCAILVDGATSDSLQIIIQDNLTGLSTFTACAIGHYTKD